jgi:3',5'-cyclic AMP phosphodiesterase CpdA
VGAGVLLVSLWYGIAGPALTVAVLSLALNLFCSGLFILVYISGRMTSLPIWDLRQGDNEDNRASSHGRGLWSVVLTATLEFSYLKATIGFLALILGPALLVGIMPSVVVTYGHQMLQTITLAGSRPIVALGLLAALVGAALWIGRPLLARIADNVWHLHYTLVFPSYVALRELLRTVAEWFLGRSITPEQIDRRRRFGTILAALLLAGGGLVVAMAVLGNAAVVLGLSTAVESCYWLWRELTIKGPVLDWVPNPPVAESSVVRVAHLSDLHIVGERYGYRMEAGTNGPRGNECVGSALRKLAAVHALAPLDRILVSGDITDAGTRVEWAEFIDLLECYPELRARLSFVPGNHDVNIVDRTNPGRLDLPWSAGQSLRMLRVVLALDAVQGDRAHLVDRSSGALGPSLKDYLREGGRVELLQALAQRGTVRGRREMAKVWNAIFPLLEPPLEGDGCGVILLNSNARSHFSLTNAIGVVNPSQLNALKLILRNSPRRNWLILLHHQVVEYPVTSISLTDRIGLALINAPDVLAAIAPHAARVLVLHGHRHRDWIGTCGAVVLCSAPSAALGSEEEEMYRGSFHIHDVAFGAEAGIRLTTTERVQVA